MVVPDGVDVDHDNHHDNHDDNALQILVDLWPVTAVTGVLDLDSSGRVRAVLEEKTRPVGLLFGVPSQSLVGQPLGVMVALPPGCGRPDDLLSLQSTKKSSLKATRKESSVKVRLPYIYSTLSSCLSCRLQGCAGAAFCRIAYGRVVGGSELQLRDRTPPALNDCNRSTKLHTSVVLSICLTFSVVYGLLCAVSKRLQGGCYRYIVSFLQLFP